MAISIPGLSTLYAILKRDIELRNEKLFYRRSLAESLYENCLAWSKALIDTFERAVDRWAEDGRGAAEREIMALVNDFQKINYYSLRKESPVGWLGFAGQVKCLD